MKPPLLPLVKTERPRAYQPQVLVPAFFATAGAVAFGVIELSAAFAYFAVNVAIGAALNLLAPKPQAPVDQGYTVNSITTVGDHAIIWGEDKVGGVVFYDEVTDNKKYFHRLIALAGHECDAITEVWFNDEKLTLDEDGNVTSPEQYAGKARIRKHLGAADQSADAALVGESSGIWSNQHRARGICYIYVRLLYDREAYPRGLPTVTATVRGRKIFDSRTGLTAWSDNAALCALDYFTSDIGLGVDIGKIDLTAYSVAANICDEVVAGADGKSAKRYTVNGTTTTKASPKSLIEALHGAMAGLPIYGPSTWRSLAGAYQLPTKTLNENDLRSPVSTQPRFKRSVNFNRISGVFHGAETQYKPDDYPLVASDVFLAEDGGRKNPNDTFDLPFTNTSAMAQRLAKIALYQQREQITFQAAFGMNAFDIAVGDTVKFSYGKLAWVKKVFQVVNWKFAIGENNEPIVNMGLRETSPGVFDWNAEEAAFLRNNTNFPDPGISEVPGIIYSTELRLVNEKATAILKVQVLSEAVYTDRFEVEYKQSGSDAWINAGTAAGTLFEILDVIDGDYDIRARTITTVGIKSNWNEVTDIPLKIFSDPPDDVTGFYFTLNNNNLVFRWDAVSSLDLSHYVLRKSTSDGSFSSSIIVVGKIPRPGTTVTVPASAGIYYIKAIDKTGVRSVNSAMIAVSKLDYEDWKLVTTRVEHPGFAGRKRGVRVSTRKLTITNLTQDTPTGTYEFANAIDLGGLYNPLVTIEIASIRQSSAGDLVDDLQGLIDDLQGLWDGVEYSDVNIRFEAKIGTRAWAAFSDGELRARALKFRATLDSQTPGTTPAIIQITTRVYLKRRTASASGVASTVAPKRIEFGAKFHTLETVVTQIDNPASGDRTLVTARDRSGFTIVVQNAAGSAVARQISYVATGYGMEQEA